MGTDILLRIEDLLKRLEAGKREGILTICESQDPCSARSTLHYKSSPGCRDCIIICTDSVWCKFGKLNRFHLYNIE